MKFYVCKRWGNIITHLKDAGVRVVCCQEPMSEMVPGSTDAATEKHVPVVEISGQNVVVKIGSVAHPMAEEHFIQWIVVETNKGYQVKHLNPGQAPEATFVLTEGESFVAAYEYCNLHGLWKKEA